MTCEKCGAKNASTVVFAQIVFAKKTKKAMKGHYVEQNYSLKGTRNVSLCDSCVNYYAKNCMEQNREAMIQLCVILGGAALVGVILTIVPLTIRWIGAALFGAVALLTLPAILKNARLVRADRLRDEAQAIAAFRSAAATAHLNPRTGEQFIPYEQLSGKTAEQIKHEWKIPLPLAKTLEAQANKFGYICK